jgi:hypothetical protein
MAKIVGLDGLSGEQLEFELQRGGQFVVFQYCISILVMTFRRSSDIHFFRAGEPRTAKGLPYCGISLLLGWWGIPWGPIWTISTTFRNLRGGLDVTGEIVQTLAEPAPAPTVR